MNSTDNKRIHENPSCFVLQIIGSYMLVLFISSIILNPLNIWIYRRAKLLTPINFFMMTLICINFISTIFEAPPIIYNAYRCK